MTEKCATCRHMIKRGEYSSPGMANHYRDQFPMKCEYMTEVVDRKPPDIWGGGGVNGMLLTEDQAACQHYAASHVASAA